MYYVIRSVNTGKLIEAHDALSLAWALAKVETHNRLYPSGPWALVAEKA